MLKPIDFYVDLGTANTLVYAKTYGLILNEPSVFAVRHRSAYRQELFALGTSAKKMLGKNPENLSVRRPLREGVIADFDSTAQMLHAFVKRIQENIFWFKPRMIISLPCKVTRHEKRAVEEIGYALGARKIHLLDEPVAAAIGAGLPVLGHRGHMIVDIGGGTTEIAVLSLGGIVAAHGVRIGGDNLDEAIIHHLRSQFNFLVGEQTAERIKIHVASASSDPSCFSQIEIGGLNLMTGIPSLMTVTSEMIHPAVNTVLSEIILAIKKTLEECPPEIAGDLAQNGIVLAGGGALLKGIKERVALETGVPVKIAENPLLAVAMGGAKALESARLFDAIEHPA